MTSDQRPATDNPRDWVGKAISFRLANELLETFGLFEARKPFGNCGIPSCRSDTLADSEKLTDTLYENRLMPPMNTQQTSRRHFVKTAVTGAGASYLGSGAKLSAADPSTDSSEPLRLGIIGVANRAKSNIAGVKSQDIRAVCDIDSRYLDNACEEFPKADRYTDYRELISQSGDLDAVVISTPDHHHAPAAMRAIKAGLHVYCEKPLAHTVAEVRALTKAAKDAGVKTQMGTQIHSFDNYRRVVEIIRSGAIGDISEVHVWVGKGKGWGATEMPGPTGGPAPENIDWDLWQGPAATRAYTTGLHPASWRRYRPYGSGNLGDMGCHYMDLPFWALQLRCPTTISADGTPPSEQYCPTGLKVSYQFAATDHHSDLKMTWYDGDFGPNEIGGTPVPGSGVLFVGDRGKMIATYGGYQLLPEDQFKTFTPPAKTIASSPGHYQEWFDAIAGGPDALCHFGYAGPLTESVLLGTVAHRAGRTITWDGDQATIKKDEEANRMLTKQYRTGWETI